MTTTDLIEKYGIGHNCLSDAYALGMAHGLDALENACELAEKKARADERPKAFGAGFASGYEKGRADAIYEYKHKLITDVSARAQSFEKIHDKHDSEIFNYATRTFVDALKFF